jgi:small subunit ribosomal protein S2
MNILSLNISLGMHLGHCTNDVCADSYIFQYLYGIRKNYYIFNLYNSIFLLRRSLFFLEYLSSYNPINCICFIHSMSSYSDLVNSMLSYLSTKTKQPSFNSNWISGTLTNWKQLVYEMIRSLFIRKKDRFEYGFFIVLAKLLFICTTRYARMEDLEFSTKYYILSRFWKFILLFQFFYYLRKLPNCFFLVNPDLNYNITAEVSRLNLPVVTLYDSTVAANGLTYIIPSNDDSIILSFFYCNLFMHSIYKGSYKFYTLNTFSLRNKKLNSIL